MEHNNPKNVNDSDILIWFVLGLIPIVNLIVLWKMAKIIAYHESKK